jgi:hypothetical protein
MDAPVPYSNAISPVCLAPSSTNPDQYAEKEAAVMGWGTLTEGNITTTTKSQYFS